MNEDSAVASFAIRADRCPQVLNRLTGLFAQSDLIPRCVTARGEGDHLAVEIVQPGISRHRAAIIAEKMRVIVTVRSVHAEWSDPGESTEQADSKELLTILV
jgi:hypothetical protein